MATFVDDLEELSSEVSSDVGSIEDSVEEDEDDLSSITQESNELPPLEPIPSPPVKKIGLLDWYGHLVIIIWLSAVVFAFCSNPKHKTKFSPLKLNSFPNSSF